jgi:hypothetical protein
MAVVKRVLCRERLRQVPSQFSWVDHRLVRDRHICRCSHPALALYLFLVTVCDGEGLSYYSDASLCRLLHLDNLALARARQELLNVRLIAYQTPLYQVLALDPHPRQAEPVRTATNHAGQEPAPPTPREPSATPLSLGQILQQMMEHTP